MAGRSKKKVQRPDDPARIRKRLSVAALAEAIPKFRGNLASISRHFDVTRGSVWEYVERHEELKVLVRDAREVRVDDAESSLDIAIQKGEGWAITLILKTLGKERGYVERQETEHSGGIVNTHVYIPQKDAIPE